MQKGTRAHRDYVVKRTNSSGSEPSRARASDRPRQGSVAAARARVGPFASQLLAVADCKIPEGFFHGDETRLGHMGRAI